MQKKKILAGVLAAAMAMTTLAGCGAGASGSSAAAGGTAENTAVQTEAGGQIEYGIVEPQCDLDSLVQVFIIKDFEVVE